MNIICIKYKRTIKETISEEGVNRTITPISDNLSKLNVDKIESTTDGVHFQNSFFNGQGRYHLMAPVDEGWITINPQRKMLIYKISITRMILLLCGICSFFILLTVNLPRWMPITLISFLLGGNILITVIRHSFFANKIKKQVLEILTRNN